MPGNTAGAWLDLWRVRDHAVLLQLWMNEPEESKKGTARQLGAALRVLKKGKQLR